MSAVTVTKIGEALGAEVSGVDASQPISADTVARLNQAINKIIRDVGVRAE